MEQCRMYPCDGKVNVITTVHIDDIVIAGTDETCEDFYPALVTNCHVS